jgi:hypothetical protein
VCANNRVSVNIQSQISSKAGSLGGFLGVWALVPDHTIYVLQGPSMETIHADVGDRMTCPAYWGGSTRFQPKTPSPYLDSVGYSGDDGKRGKIYRSPPWATVF